MMKTPFCSDDYLALLCGSSLIEDEPRDIDIMIYTCEEENLFSRKLFDCFAEIDSNAKLTYVDELMFYSLKYNSFGFDYSVHIVSMERLFYIVREANLIETYIDINIFDVKLYSQTVYRKWIYETEYLIGNISLKENLINELKKQKKPIKIAKQKLVFRIKNNVNYYNEKVDDDVFLCNVVLGQIINNLINYCYLVNDTYYGTVKYIKRDLENFDRVTALCELTISIIESINKRSIRCFSEMVNGIMEMLE